MVRNEPVSVSQSADEVLWTWTVAVATWSDAMTGSDTMTGALQTGSVDDTELPLDQRTWSTAQDPAVTDPDVEEIIGLLEELIEESEQQK